MESIARTKPNMSVLRRDILPVSPFGILSQAFTEEILDRFESGSGMYPMYGLEFLYPEEESTDETPAGGNVHLEVQLKLILQQLKESGKTTAAERILGKAETLRLLREKTVVRQAPGGAEKAAPHRTPAAMGRTLSSKAFMPQQSVASAGGDHRRPGTYTGAAASGRNGTSGIYAAPMVSTGNGWSGTHVTAETLPGARPRGTMGTEAADMQSSLQGEALWGQRAQTVPAVAEIGHNTALTQMGSPMVSTGNGRSGTHVTAETLPGVKSPGTMGTAAADTQISLRGKALWGQRAQTVPAVPAIGRDTALMQMGSPTVVGLPGQMGPALAEVQFLMPQEADASGRQTMEQNKTAAGLTRRMEQAAAQAAEAIAKAIAMEPQGARADDHHQRVRQAPSNTERKAPSGDRLRVEQTRREAGKDAPGRDSGAVAGHASAGTAAPNGGQPIQMKRTTPATKVAEEIHKDAAPSIRQNGPAAIQPAADHAMANRLAAEPLTAGRLPGHLPATERPAANGHGVLRDLENLAMNRAAAGPVNTRFGINSGITFEIASGTTEGGYIPAELAGQPPLTLEYLQESQKDDIQAAEQMQALPPKVLEKLLDTPGLRLLSKDIAVLAAEGRESRPVPHHRSQAAQQTAHRPGQAGGTVNGGAVNGGAAYPGTPGAAEEMTFTKPSAAGHSALSPGDRRDGFPGSHQMGLSSVRMPGGTTAGGMALLETAAAAQSHTWSPASQPPVELAHMEPSLETQAAGPAGQAAGAQQAALLKEIQRSLAGGRPGATQSGRNTVQTQTGLEARTFNRGVTAGPVPAARRGFPPRGPGKLTAAGRMGGFPRGRGTVFGAAPGTAADGGMAQEDLSVYPALSMEYGGPLVAMARELRQTAARELGQAGAAREMGLHTPAARAMEEKGTPETMQTLDLMTQPQIQEQQVVWENPYLRSAPMEMTHHQKNNPQNRQRAQQSQPQLRMSDAEIRRAADKVFKLVQEKIINERRRSGRM